MKKKNIEKLAEKRKTHVEAMEIILRRRNAEIKDLKEQIEGYKQVVRIMQAFIVEGISKNEGEIRIPIEALTEAIKTEYKVDMCDGMYVITAK